MVDLTRLPEESEESFIWRLGRAKDSGELDMSWDAIAKIINEQFRLGNENDYSESAYRKSYQVAKRFYEAGVFENIDDYISDLKEAKTELEKAKVKFRDERNEYNKLIREQARREHYKDQIKKSIEVFVKDPLGYTPRQTLTRDYSDNDLIVSFTDVHTGIDIDNYFNRFDYTVLKKRINYYLSKVISVGEMHGSEHVYVVLSELVSGIIHPVLRIENNQNLIDQFLTVCEYLVDFLQELSYNFKTVNVYIAPGNHSRINPKKDEALRGENMDILAMPYLKAKLQKYNNINIVNNAIDEYVAMFNVRGQTVMAVHGDRDTPDNVVQKLVMFFGIKPDIVCMGHRHTNSLTTVYDSKVVQSGCFSGSDSYCMDLKLRNKPEQAILVVNKNGIDCMYNVVLQ